MMRIAIAQMNPTTGDFEENLACALAFCDIAKDAHADLVVFPAYALCGDAAGNMVESVGFSHAARSAVDAFALNTPIPAVIGSLAGEGTTPLDASRPAAFFCKDGRITKLEMAWNSSSVPAFRLSGKTFAVGIDRIPTFSKSSSPDVVIDLCAVPYKGHDSLVGTAGCLRAARTSAVEGGIPVIVANLIGGADDKVYSGGSYCLRPDGSLICGCACFRTDLVCFDLAGDGSCRAVPVSSGASAGSAEGVATGAQEAADPAPAGGTDAKTPSFSSAEEIAPHAAAYRDSRPAVPSRTEADWLALELALSDYLAKNRLSDVVIGLSGGIDSAVVTTIAADALGPEHVHVVLMPSSISSEGSVTDSKKLVGNLGIADARTIPITEPLETLCSVLGPECGGKVQGLALENLQSRIRTLYLMTLSNTYGWTLLNTGNKSEAAMGFSTLYGDTAGAYALLGDVSKTHVWELARWRNTKGKVIPREIIEKVPSAELHEGQRDDDRIPPYDKLDPILVAHVEGGKGIEELVGEGFDPALCDEVLRTITKWEFKRRQEPVCPAISPRSFAERGWPITNRFVDKNPSID